MDARLERLLEPGLPSAEACDLTRQWYAEWLDLLGVTDPVGADPSDEASLDLALASGKAVSPITAAGCLTDHNRTVQFLRAMDAAILRALDRVDGRPVRVLEAGCGPFAPLSLPFARRYGPDKVRFTLLDANPFSLSKARRLAGYLGVEPSIQAYLEIDAAQIMFAEADRPDIIACELIQRALTSEPQAVVTRSLAPQLAPGGAFLPRRIEVRAGLFDAQARYARQALDPSAPPETGMVGVELLDEVLVLDADTLDSDWPAVEMLAPPHRAETLHLLTRIVVDEAHVIEDFDAAITLPEPVGRPGLEAGGRLLFQFQEGPPPGWRVTGPAD